MLNVVGYFGINAVNCAPSCYASGPVFWNGNTQRLEIISNSFDRIQLQPDQVTVSLDQSAITAISWVNQEIIKEATIKKQIEQNSNAAELLQMKNMFDKLFENSVC